MDIGRSSVHCALRRLVNRYVLAENVNRTQDGAVRLQTTGTSRDAEKQFFLPYFRLLSKNVRTEIYRTIILPVILYGCETWSLTLREQRRLKVFQNRVLRKILGPKRDEITLNGENYIMRSLMICTPHQILFGRSNQEERWTGHVARMRRREVHKGF